MTKVIVPEESDRCMAYRLWMKAPNPMVTFFKTLDVTCPIRISKSQGLKFNMLMDYCIGKAASSIKEFYVLPVGEELIQYDRIALNTIVKNKNGEVNSCDLLFSENLDEFNREYLEYTSHTAESCTDRDLSADNMVIGTSAVIETEIDGIVNMYSGFNNPFLSWGRYRESPAGFLLPVSFQFHHTQMDGGHAGRFLENLKEEIRALDRSFVRQMK